MKKQRLIARMVEMYRQVVDELDEGVHVVDESGKTLIYNRKMAEMEQMRPEDVLEHDLVDVFTFPEEGYSTLLRVLRTGEPIVHVKQTYFNREGKPITTINHTKPIFIEGQLCGAMETARDITQIDQIQKHLLREASNPSTFEQMIGENPRYMEVLLDAKRTARTSSPILLVGETGTGKDLIARSIHFASPRSQGPFVAQNFAALPPPIIERILFGTVKGAFPDAVDTPGLFEQAHGGTILLDDLTFLDLSLQASVLRSIQEKSVRRLGDSVDRTVDVRIIATIREDPLDAIASLRLRKDLYYRLSVVTLFLPALRERASDIRVLTNFFVQKYNQLFGMSVRGVSDEVMNYFMAHAWPGNVRELEHVVEGAMNMASSGEEIQMVHLPMHVRRRAIDLDEGQDEARTEGIERNLQHQLEGYERAYVLNTLRRNDGNVSATARELGVSRQSLQYRLRKWNVNRSP